MNTNKIKKIRHRYIREESRVEIIGTYEKDGRNKTVKKRYQK